VEELRETSVTLAYAPTEIRIVAPELVYLPQRNSSPICLALWTCILKTLGSILGRNTSYPDRFFMGFLSPIREHYLETGHDRFFPQSFPSH
jgi:hypothetical protein